MSFKNIKSGDRVYYSDGFDELRSGKANALLIFPDHVVVDIGGRFGTPKVINESNYVKHRSKNGGMRLRQIQEKK